MKMNLEKTWIETLRMWRWIINQLSEDFPVWKLKEMWLSANNYPDTIYNNCFFCNYAIKRGDDCGGGPCPNCPGCKVDDVFDCEGTFDWIDRPLGFYEELLRLNKKRLSKKGKA